MFRNAWDTLPSSLHPMSKVTSAWYHSFPILTTFQAWDSPFPFLVPVTTELSTPYALSRKATLEDMPSQTPLFFSSGPIRLCAVAGSDLS